MCLKKKIPGKLPARGLIFCFAVLFLLAILAEAGLFRVSETINPDTIIMLSENSAAAPFQEMKFPFLKGPAARVFPPLLIRDFKPPHISGPVVLLKNGLPLRSVQSSYNNIIKSKSDKFLHIDGWIIFSWPENESPEGYGLNYPLKLHKELFVFLGMTLIAFFLLRGWLAAFWENPFMTLKRDCLKIGWFSFFLGLVLIILNIYGLVFPIKAKNDPRVHDWVYDRNIRPSVIKSYDTRKLNSETKLMYAIRLNKLIHAKMIYSWPDKLVNEYFIRIPPRENYILYILSFFSPKYYYYEFINPDKAFSRGVGLCSQQALCLSGFLEKEGIDSGILHLDGHVVVAAMVEKDLWHIFDPGFGVYIPFSIDALEKNPEIAEKYYSAVLKFNSGENFIDLPLDFLPSLYGPHGNFLDYMENPSDFLKSRMIEEKLFYVLKWTLPLIFMLPFFFMLIKRRFFHDLNE